MATVQLAKVGSWQFDMPEAWLPKDNESSDSYFEAPDGEKGLYVKCIELPHPEASPHAVAEYVQGVHFTGFTEISGSKWVVQRRTAEEHGGLVRSILDLYDVQASYRVLSLVVCGKQQAIQITVHDYWCTDYAATCNTFGPLVASVHSTQSMV
jgi:hypothetical protein